MFPYRAFVLLWVQNRNAPLYSRDLAGEHGKKVKGQCGEGWADSRGGHGWQELEIRCQSTA